MSIKDNNKDDWFSAGGVSWKKALHAIYVFAPNSYDRGKKGLSDDEHPLAKKLRISGNELMLSIAFLEDQNLIDSNNLKLTQKGFSVALENETAKSNLKTQQILVALTSILAMTAAVELLNNLQQSQSLINFLIMIIYIGFVISAYFIIKRKMKR